MSAITIILASLSALALAILILAAIDDRKRQQRLWPMKLPGEPIAPGHASPRGWQQSRVQHAAWFCRIAKPCAPSVINR